MVKHKTYSRKTSFFIPYFRQQQILIISKFAHSLSLWIKCANKLSRDILNAKQSINISFQTLFFAIYYWGKKIKRVNRKTFSFPFLMLCSPSECQRQNSLQIFRLNICYGYESNFFCKSQKRLSIQMLAAWGNYTFPVQRSKENNLEIGFHLSATSAKFILNQMNVGGQWKLFDLLWEKTSFLFRPMISHMLNRMHFKKLLIQ